MCTTSRRTTHLCGRFSTTPLKNEETSLPAYGIIIPFVANFTHAGLQQRGSIRKWRRAFARWDFSLCNRWLKNSILSFRRGLKDVVFTREANDIPRVIARSPPRRVHSATKQSQYSLRFRDCFASLAMTFLTMSLRAEREISYSLEKRDFSSLRSSK
jgi:hypothetical protein